MKILSRSLTFTLVLSCFISTAEPRFSTTPENAGAASIFVGAAAITLTSLRLLREWQRQQEMHSVLPHRDIEIDNEGGMQEDGSFTVSKETLSKAKKLAGGAALGGALAYLTYMLLSRYTYKHSFDRGETLMTRLHAAFLNWTSGPPIQPGTREQNLRALEAQLTRIGTLFEEGHKQAMRDYAKSGDVVPGQTLRRYDRLMDQLRVFIAKVHEELSCLKAQGVQ